MGRPRVDVTWRISGCSAICSRRRSRSSTRRCRRWRRARRATTKTARCRGALAQRRRARLPASSAPRLAPMARASRSCSASETDRAEHRRGLSRGGLAWLRRCGGRGNRAARRLRGSGSPRPISCSMSATIRRAISSKARRTPPFVGGFAAAAASLGRDADLIVLDTTDPQRPRARPLDAALARLVRGRAVNPRFIAGQMRHGPRGAAELAETVDRLVGFARDDRRGGERIVRSRA